MKHSFIKDRHGSVRKLSDGQVEVTFQGSLKHSNTQKKQYGKPSLTRQNWEYGFQA